MTSAQLETSKGQQLGLQGATALGVLRGNLLEMTVEQQFLNPEPNNVEVVYTFPLPPGAVLLGIDVLLNGQALEGQVVAKAEAREQYEEALSEGNSAILLARNHDESYTLELGNLLKDETCTIKLRYAQALLPQQGSLRIALPTTIAPRYGSSAQDWADQPHAEPRADLWAEYPFQVSVRIEGQLANARVESPSHPIGVRHFTGDAQQPVTEVSLGRNAWLDRDFLLVLSELAHPSTAVAALDRCEEVRVTVAASFTPSFPADTSKPLAVKILVDCSGSMAGDSIEAARRALHAFVVALRPEDRFTLSRFGQRVIHRCKAMWKGAGPAKHAALRWISELQGNLGGTEMLEALESTIRLPGASESDLLLITDGAIEGVDALLELAKTSRHRIFVVGIGSSPNAPMLRRLARETSAACEFVASGEAVEPAISRMFHRLRSPVARISRVEWPFNEPPRYSASMSDAIFDGDSILTYASFHAATPSDGSHTTILWGYLGTQSEEVLLAQSTVELLEDPGNVTARMAAKAQLDEESLTTAEEPVLREHKAQLAEKYQLVTEFTNFLLVHERAASDRPQDIPDLHQVPGMLAAGHGGFGRVRRAGATEFLSIADPTADLNAMSANEIRLARKLAGDYYRNDVMFSLEPLSFSAEETGLGKRKGGMTVDDLGGFDIPELKDHDLSNRSDLWAEAVDTSYLDIWEHPKNNDVSGDEAAPQSKWNVGYTGLTPAGLREILQGMNFVNWPNSFLALRAAGLGQVVIDWLAVVVNEDNSETDLVEAFLCAICLRFPSSDTPSNKIKENRSIEAMVANRSVVDTPLTLKIRSALEGSTASRWPDAIVAVHDEKALVSERIEA